MPVGLLLLLVLITFALYFDQNGSVREEKLGQPSAAFRHRHKNNATFWHRYRSNQNSSDSSR